MHEGRLVGWTSESDGRLWTALCLFTLRRLAAF
ncbi:hypothetical protein THIOKS12910030 [Thiocapsa sp. KS1]|nr:hypothetical protein THIOKS12910030 [Thiocapsa sp. KS1]